MSPERPLGGSLFASLRGLKPEEKAEPAPSVPAASAAAAAPPAASLQPVLSRLEKLESSLAEARQSDTGQRIGALEEQLKATQEQAIKAMVTLREREEAQQQAQRELEGLMKSLSAQRRSEELDRQFREQAAAQQRRIEELEAKLLAQAAAPPPADSSQRLADLEGGLSRLRGHMESLETSLRGELGALAEAMRRGAQEAASARSESERAWQDRLQGLEATLRASLSQGLQTLRGEEEQGRSAQDARLAELARAQAEHDQALQEQDRCRRQAEAALLAQCSAVLESQRSASAQAAGELSDRLEALRRDLEAARREQVEAQSTLTGQLAEIGQAAASTASRLSSGLDVQATEAEALRAQLSELRQDMDQAQQRWAQELATGRQELSARFDEELARLEAWLRGVREQAQSWEQTRTLLAETAARVEQVWGACAEGLRALDDRRMRFETEVRSLVLARVLRLEQRLDGGPAK